MRFLRTGALQSTLCHYHATSCHQFLTFATTTCEQYAVHYDTDVSLGSSRDGNLFSFRGFLGSLFDVHTQNAPPAFIWNIMRATVLGIDQYIQRAAGVILSSVSG
ncbi:hypothetical protein B0O80DRAFT_425173 [Mortierella sp. GBAus27b]|nr:hypothetical protein B0O80DRAFT_425173 [Mortierella sp. GBAus27b]